MAAVPKPKEALMPKLIDTQAVILSAAAQRHDRAILPLPKSLKVPKAAATTVLKSLLKKGLVAERPAAVDEPHWRKSKDGGRRALVITEAGLQAIGVDADKKTSTQSRSAKQKPKQRSRRAERKHCVAEESPAVGRAVCMTISSSAQRCDSAGDHRPASPRSPRGPTFSSGCR